MIEDNLPKRKRQRLFKIRKTSLDIFNDYYLFEATDNEIIQMLFKNWILIYILEHL
jgi:hypothetical protein